MPANSPLFPGFENFPGFYFMPQQDDLPSMLPQLITVCKRSSYYNKIYDWSYIAMPKELICHHAPKSKTGLTSQWITNSGGPSSMSQQSWCPLKNSINEGFTFGTVRSETTTLRKG